MTSVTGYNPAGSDDDLQRRKDFAQKIWQQSVNPVGTLVEKYLPLSGMKFLTADEHRELFENAGYSEVKLATESGKGWITAIGKKPV